MAAGYPLLACISWGAFRLQYSEGLATPPIPACWLAAGARYANRMGLAVQPTGRKQLGAGDHAGWQHRCRSLRWRSEEHTSELQSLMRISYAVFCLKKKKKIANKTI